MRLRRNIRPPSRYEDEDEISRRRGNGTKPHFPDLLQSQIVPFNPDHSAAAFPSLPLLESRHGSRRVDSPETHREVQATKTATFSEDQTVRSSGSADTCGTSAQGQQNDRAPVNETSNGANGETELDKETSRTQPSEMRAMTPFADGRASIVSSQHNARKIDCH